jgi:hypothetical protein
MSGSTQKINSAVTGPVFSNGGAITVTNSGSIANGAEGVYVENYSITTLSNMGSIGAASVSRDFRLAREGSAALGC